jgi:hypothetical protein
MERGSAVNRQVPDRVVHVDGRKSWTNTVLASFRPSDHHVSDDEIFEILNAGNEGDTASKLCAAKGFTLPMYCVWKTKYRHLSLDDMRKVRRRELWRGRCLLGVLLAASVLATGGIVFGLARAARTNITAADAPSAVTSLATTESGPGQRNRDGHSQPNTALGTATEMPPRVRPESRPAAPTAITEPGYKIQVAAAETLQEGRVFLERLASAGYPAYLSRAIVSDTEVFRVRVGPFDALPAAREIASKLQRDGYNGAWIAR